MAMFEGVADLTLAMLNGATQAWAEFDHSREIHSDISEAPITRFLAGPDVTRPCPTAMRYVLPSPALTTACRGRVTAPS
jgi:putative transposase